MFFEPIAGSFFKQTDRVKAKGSSFRGQLSLGYIFGKTPHENSKKDAPKGSYYSYPLMLKLADKFDDSTGQYKVVGNCNNGRIEGAFCIKTENGITIVEGTLKEGKLEGKAMIYASTGEPLVSMMLKDSFLDGEATMWFHPNTLASMMLKPKPGGNVKLKAHYVMGRLYGIKNHYIPTGKKKARYRYDQGTLMSARVYDIYGSTTPRKEAWRIARNDDLADIRYYGGIIGMVNSLTRCVNE